ncbi:MAG: hypothetical protein QM662_18570 [Gordonia sp. (in: high G+C Gram-positive bacteria)]
MKLTETFTARSDQSTRRNGRVSLTGGFRTRRQAARFPAEAERLITPAEFKRLAG